MRLIVGLGNPGPEYAKTRHNLGWMVADQLATQLRTAPWRPSAKFKAELAGAGVGADKLVLVKPTTFMNESGLAVRALMDFYKLEPADLTVVHDDIDMEFGKLRLTRGGSGGHNGVESIIKHLGHQDFNRLKVGVAAPDLRAQVDPSDFVLARFSAEEESELPQLIAEAISKITNP